MCGSRRLSKQYSCNRIYQGTDHAKLTHSTTHNKENLSGISDGKIGNFEHQSASAIREEIKKDNISALDYVPVMARNIFSEEISKKLAPCREDLLSAAIISYFRLADTEPSADLADSIGGLYNRLKALSFEANSLAELTSLGETKKYTTARLRRAIWYYYFSVTSSEISAPCAYTQVLALNAKGSALLKRIKRTSNFPIITKPSSIKKLSGEALSQKLKSDRADSIFQLT